MAPFENSGVLRRKAEDIAHVLRDRVALLPGSRDREGRPIVFVPCLDNSTPITADHLRNLLLYLFDVTADDAKSRGFVLVIDTRKGNSGDVKPVLKCLQEEFFSGKVAKVYIIKPEKFWSKPKISVASGKNKLEIQSVSAENLGRHIDFNQIPREFGGTMLYDHDDWLELRVEIERLIGDASKMLTGFLKCEEAIQNAETPVDVATSEMAIQIHREMEPFLLSLKVEMIEGVIRELEKRIFAKESSIPISSLNDNIMASNAAVALNSNPDLISIIPNLHELVRSLKSTRAEVLSLWEAKNQELSQICQLKTFESDYEQLDKWICNIYDELSMKSTLIGFSQAESKQLLDDNLAYKDSIEAQQITYDKVFEDGRRLSAEFSTGRQQHLAASITNFMQQLARKWKALETLVEQRRRLLSAAIVVHQKYAEFRSKFDVWIENVGVDPDSLACQSHDEMRAALESHEEFERLYEIVYSEAFERTNQLMKLMKKCFDEKSVVHTDAYAFLTRMVDDVTQKKRQLHSIWKSRRETIHYRMSAAVFFSDMRSVMDWLEQHGEPFLHRKIAIGHDLQSAQNLTNNHENFKKVAENTYRNARQLFTMAQQLKNSGEVDQDQINYERIKLQKKLELFRTKVELRSNLLYIASCFFLHFNEISSWYVKMEARDASLNTIPDSVEECELCKEQLQGDNDGTMQAYARVMLEAQQLRSALEQQRQCLSVDNSETIRHIDGLVARIEKCHTIEKQRWANQRLMLNVAAKVATFLRDCKELRHQLLGWRDDLNTLKPTLTQNPAMVMHFHRQNTESVRTGIIDCMNQMTEIVQLIQRKGLNLIVQETQQTAQDAVMTAATQLQELERQVMEVAMGVSERIEWRIQEKKILEQANATQSAIDMCEGKLRKANYIPGDLSETKRAIVEHDQLRHECDAKAGQLVSSFMDHFNNLMLIYGPDQLQAVAGAVEEVKKCWHKLIGLSDSRQKLLNTSMNFFKYLYPVRESVLKELERATEFTDLCQQCDAVDLGSADALPLLDDLCAAVAAAIETTEKRRHSFLEAIAQSQKESDLLFKLVLRSQAPKDNVMVRMKTIEDFKSFIRSSNQQIVMLYGQRADHLEQCRSIVDLLRAAVKVTESLTAKYELHSAIVERGLHQSIDDLKRGYGACKATTKEFHYRIREWLKRSDDLKRDCHNYHRTLAERAERYVREAYQRLYDLSARFDTTLRSVQYRTSGDNSTGMEASSVSSQLDVSLRDEISSLDRCSDSTLEERLKHHGHGQHQQQEQRAGEQAQRRGSALMETTTKPPSSACRKMTETVKELIQTERDYIDHLKLCIDVYLHAYRDADGDGGSGGTTCPTSLRKKEFEIFGNVEQLYQFHSEEFLSHLLMYERSPEDIGYCFIQFMEKLKELYTEYCLNKEENNTIIDTPEAIQFFSEIRERNRLDHNYSLASMVIRPVQRIGRYQLLLESIKSLSNNAKAVQDMHDVVFDIPKLANDRLHLKNFDKAEAYKVGEFIMQDAFVMPPRYFKREREVQVFLFESNIVFTKREDIAPRRFRYVYKESMLLREIHVVEHVEGDQTKFGLRKVSQIHQNDSTIVLRAASNSTRMLWVRTLRNLKMDLRVDGKKSIISDSSSVGSGGGSGFIGGNLVLSESNRNSQLSHNSCTSTTSSNNTNGNGFEENGASDHQHNHHGPTSSSSSSLSLPSTKHRNNRPHVITTTSFGGGKTPMKGDQFLINEDFVATAPGQLSVLSGQRVELLERLDAPSSSDVAGVRLPEDATATTSGNNRLLEPSTTTDDEEGGASADERMAVVTLVGAAERARGAVPTRILTPARPTAGAVDAAERRDANSAPAACVDKSTAETSSSSSGGGSGGGANLSGSASSTQKRSSLRRFFNNNSNNNSALTSQQQQQSHSANVESGATGVNNNRNREEQQQGCCSTVTAAASTSSTTNSQQQSYSDNAPPSVLSATSSAATAALPLSADQSPLNQLPHFGADEDQPGTTTITTTTLTAATARDADLPPPMSQLNSAATATASYDSGGGDATTAGAPTSLPVTNSSAIADSGSFAAATALVSGNGAGSGAESAAGTPQEVAAATSAIDQMSPAEAARLKRQYVLNELVETERIYVQDLASVVDGYIGNLSSMELPEDLQGKDKIIFANIAQILDFHKTTFLKEIEKCLTDYEAAGNAFVKYERRLNAYYVKYCQNKPKSDFLVSQESFEQFFAETKQKLGHKVALADLLIKPIQRITKYQLMLKDIVKYTERAGDRLDVLNRALEVMRIVPKACDDMMQVGRLQNFEGNLNAQGRLLFQGTLLISDGSPSQPFRGKERRVFLFEQSAIIADYIPPRKEYGNPTYVFKNQIMVNKMVLEENVADEPLRFVLTSNDPAQPAAVFVAQAASAEDKRQWLAKISAQLDQQKTFLAALVDPKRYQSQLANSVGSLSLTGKKDSSSSLGAASTLPSNNNNSSAPHSATVGGFSSPRHNNTGGGKSKLFGFGKSKS